MRKSDFTIENEDKLIEESHEAKLKAIANRIYKANEELIALGYTTYISSHGSWNIMNGDSHGKGAEALRGNAVANFHLYRLDAGDW